MGSNAREIYDEAGGKRGSTQCAVYSLEDLAHLLGESYPATWGSFNAGKLPWVPIRIGRKVYFRRSEVNRDLGIED
jgi:predicted DNA-binding transcriptional regulator AlpA